MRWAAKANAAPQTPQRLRRQSHLRVNNPGLNCRHQSISVLPRMPSSSRCCRGKSKNWNRIAQSSSVLQGLGNLDWVCTNPSVHVRVVHAFKSICNNIFRLSHAIPSRVPSCLVPFVAASTHLSLGLCRYSRFRTAHCSRSKHSSRGKHTFKSKSKHRFFVLT